MLYVGGYTGVVCSKENSLVVLVIVEPIVLIVARCSYHEPDIGDLRRGEDLGK